ncbi:hypothetical protein V1478_003618 [Vespula squamosa]|uniref:Uncharacterized protein n=1 Tax=Vespula squamosa TaxID=30214 RepID=A0ABD2BMP3_VESSQ
MYDTKRFATEYSRTTKVKKGTVFRLWSSDSPELVSNFRQPCDYVPNYELSFVSTKINR